MKVIVQYKRHPNGKWRWSMSHRPGGDQILKELLAGTSWSLAAAKKRVRELIRRARNLQKHMVPKELHSEERSPRVPPPALPDGGPVDQKV